MEVTLVLPVQATEFSQGFSLNQAQR
jgi:hypothetical protein